MTTLFHSRRRVKSSRNFAHGLLSADPVIQEADAAWFLGFTLGLSWEDAGPTATFTPFQTDAFLDGFDKGRSEAEQDRMEAFAHFDDGYEDEMDRQAEESELAELRTSSRAMAEAQSNIHRPPTSDWARGTDGVMRNVMATVSKGGAL